MSTWTKKPRMPACHQLMPPAPMLVMRAPPKQDVLSIQLIANRRTNGSPRFATAEPIFLATTAVPEDPAEAIRGGLVLTPLLGCKAKTPLDWTHAWAMLGGMGRNYCLPYPRARRMAASRRWSILTARLCPANPALPHMGPSHLRAGSALPHVGLPSPLSHPLPPRGQVISKQRVRRWVRPSTRCTCLPWEQGWPRTEAPTVAK